MTHRNIIARILIFALWLMVFGLSLSRHTPWRDEYQSWLVSTRSETFGDFIEGVRYERHPPGHYLLQRALSRGIPASLDWEAKTAINVVTVPFVIGSVLLILFGIGFGIPTAVFLIFGTLLFREYGVISRTYVIGTFFVLSAIWSHQQNRKNLFNLCLVLAGGTHLLFTLAAGSLWLCQLLREGWKEIRHPRHWLTACAFLAILALQAPPPDPVHHLTPLLSWEVVVVLFRQLNQTLWGLEKVWKPFEWNRSAVATDLCLLALPFMFYWMRLWVDLRRFFFVALPPLAILAIGYTTAARHLGAIFFSSLACFLIFERARATLTPKQLELRGKLPHPISAFAFTMFISMVAWWVQWAPFKQPPNFDFSGARELTQALPDLSSSDSILLVEKDFLYFSWAAEAKANFFHVKRDRVLRYPYFRKSELRYEGFAEWCASRLPNFREANQGRTIFLGLQNTDPYPQECGSAELVFETKRPVATDEAFKIYRLN